ncbi:MAG: hypothetical protein QXX08_05035 [Candidatus Bathyarchaeia archaeon]
MNPRIKYLLLIYVSTVAFLLFFVSINQRNYQDSWILEDIFIPTIIYVIIFTLVVVEVNDNKIVATLCASFTVILNAIPNLKYQMFYGTADSMAHFGFVKSLLMSGRPPTINVYSDFPGMHILIGSFSLISGADVNISIKFVTSTIFSIIPLLTYFLTNQVFGKNVQKYMVIASSLPLVLSYTLTGTTFAISLFCPFMYLLFKRHLSKEYKREYTLLLIIIAFGLLYSHLVTMVSLLMFLCIMLILIRLFHFTEKTSYSALSRTTIGVLSLILVSFIAWLMFEANFVFEMLIDTASRLLTGQVSKAPIPQRFFEIPFVEELKFFVLKYIKDVIIVLLSSAGLLVLLKNFRHKNDYIFKNFYIPLVYFLGATLFLIAFQFATRFGEIEYRRFIDYAMLLSPFLTGIFLLYITERFRVITKKDWLSVLLTTLILFTCISACMIQTFPYQPLVPRASVLAEELPENEYITELMRVNTIFQEKMILFAEKFSSKNANITSDTVTRWQIYGLANETFINRYIWCYPLGPEANIESKQWSILLLHYSGKSGPLDEKVEYRTNEAIDNLRNLLVCTVYDNGESFIVSKKGI